MASVPDELLSLQSKIMSELTTDLEVKILCAFTEMITRTNVTEDEFVEGQLSNTFKSLNVKLHSLKEKEGIMFALPSNSQDYLTKKKISYLSCTTEHFKTFYKHYWAKNKFKTKQSVGKLFLQFLSAKTKKDFIIQLQEPSICDHDFVNELLDDYFDNSYKTYVGNKRKRYEENEKKALLIFKKRKFDCVPLLQANGGIIMSNAKQIYFDKEQNRFVYINSKKKMGKKSVEKNSTKFPFPLLPMKKVGAFIKKSHFKVLEEILVEEEEENNQHEKDEENIAEKDDNKHAEEDDVAMEEESEENDHDQDEENIAEKDDKNHKEDSEENDQHVMEEEDDEENIAEKDDQHEKDDEELIAEKDDQHEKDDEENIAEKDDNKHEEDDEENIAEKDDNKHVEDLKENHVAMEGDSEDQELFIQEQRQSDGELDDAENDIAENNPLGLDLEEDLKLTESSSSKISKPSKQLFEKPSKQLFEEFIKLQDNDAEDTEEACLNLEVQVDGKLEKFTKKMWDYLHNDKNYDALLEEYGIDVEED